MKIAIFGATGMIGHGVLKACLEAEDVEQVIAIGRRTAPESDPRLVQVEHDDFTDLSTAAEHLRGVDACFYCLGVSSAGMSEEEYRTITYDFTVAMADALQRASPDAVVCFVSGAGTDRDSRQMWARVKAEAEDMLRDRGFGAVYLFRPAIIQPVDGVKSSVTSYRVMYALLGPLFPLLRKFRKYVTSTREVGQAMLNAVRFRPEGQVLENVDICELAKHSPAR
jgi:uncharacterized protein YbjT (DUF2867 family)